MIPFEELHAIIRTAAGAWLRRGVPVDREDLIQEGWVIALSSLPAQERSGIPAGPYIGKALVLSLGNSIARWQSSVVLGKKHSQMPDPTRPSNLRPFEVDRSATAISPEEANILAQWARALTAELDRAIERFTLADQRLIRGLLADERPADVARMNGVHVRQVYRCRNELVRRLKKDRHFARKLGAEFPATAL